jgi:sialate O-acetylesterase
VILAPLAPSNEPAELTAAGKSKTTLSDVVVGEVWLVAGQSNMEWPVSYLSEDERKLSAVDLPLVRHLKIERAVAGAPADTAKTHGWQPALRDHVGDFSAIGYLFARDLQRRLGVPVGIVNSSWGGTAIESWMSDAARQSTPFAAAIEERWRQAMSEWPPERVARYPAEMEAWEKAEAHAKTTKTKNPMPWPQPPATMDSSRRPGGLFNAMIAPLQPGALRGFLWYQGESNVDQPAEYEALFPAMIHAWRANWGDENLPFLFVQLPNFADGNPNGRKWARLREAQASALKLPATGMTVAIDLGEPENLHPTSKLELARRLALLAKVEVYGITGDANGPVFASVTREGAGMRVRFVNAGTGLNARGLPVQSLELAGLDKVFHPAAGRIEKDTLLVTSPKVREPIAVRYAWSNAPVANLYSGAGLPAAPFRSDDW